MKIHSHLTPAAAVSVVMLLGINGCSSSDSTPANDGDNTQPPESITPPQPGGADTVPPQVVSLLPENGAREVAPDTLLSVVFNEDMFATTIDDSSFTVTDQNGNMVQGAVSFDALTNTATFTPSAALDMTLANNYSVSLANTITDLSGNALAPVAWSFAAMEHDCTPYSPEDSEYVSDGLWKPAGIDREGWEYRTVTTPGGAGGGYLTLTLNTVHPEGLSSPVIVVQPGSADGEGANILPSGEADGTMQAAISVMPGTPYDITLWNFWTVDPDLPPVEWSYEEKYTGTMDCYEPNDHRFFVDAEATARKIPLNQTLEAYMKPAYEESFMNIGVPSFHDWYKFELLQSSAVTLEVVSTPSDTGIFQALWDAEGGPIIQVGGPGSELGATESSPYNSEIQILDAGVYYLQLYPSGLQPNYAPVLSDGDPLPDAFVTPYTFRVNAESQG